jgi:hypothetical protein
LFTIYNEYNGGSLQVFSLKLARLSINIAYQKCNVSRMSIIAAKLL